ncbi:hypothetical protein DACRYDRAFT_109614 [Dacryopinax primogenitus]|uniref:DUF6533 domain-containing protein n=1 Tax=Dacryopinax primogenitus (strain DJM 731) TaxID=1858805 RepID=M5G110_DACPD|nr:uncharacterized protein DACRYDRAFT_109614 [Dacryopinax primogenitus]EJT99511.1 hypothetical protein DACRYDRAFT_109614 [Dacryopinax primogenitus]
MDQQAELEVLFQTLGDLRSYHSAEMAALSWLVYDIIIMIPLEIRHIWPSRLTPAKILFYSCRVIGLYILLLDTIVLIPLWCLFGANTTISITLSIDVVSSTTLTSAPPFVTIDGCLSSVSRTQLMLGSYISSTLFSGTAFVLTLAKLYPYWRMKSGAAPVATVFVRDGTVFFVIIFVVEVVSLIWGQIITPIRPSLQDLVNVLRMAVYSISGPRLILHLRGVVSQPSYATESRTEVTEVTEERRTSNDRSGGTGETSDWSIP